MYILYSLIFVTTQSDHVDVDKEYIYIYGEYLLLLSN